MKYLKLFFLFVFGLAIGLEIGTDYPQVTKSDWWKTAMSSSNTQLPEDSLYLTWNGDADFTINLPNPGHKGKTFSIHIDNQSETFYFDFPRNNFHYALPDDPRLPYVCQMSYRVADANGALIAKGNFGFFNPVRNPSNHKYKAYDRIGLFSHTVARL